MEPINPLLPALRFGTSSSLRRAGGLIGALRGIQQEASAEYWYELAMALGVDSGTRLAYLAKSAGVLRHEIATIRQALEHKSRDQKYHAYDSNGGIARCHFHSVDFYNDNQNTFARLLECYNYLVDLVESSVEKADMWVELDELLMAYELPHLATQCHINPIVCKNRLQVKKATQAQSLQLYNPELYQYSLSSKEQLLDFIKINFWYFLNAIIQKESRKDYTGGEISKEILQKIKISKNIYEYPRCSYESRLEGDVFDKIKDRNLFEISVKLDNGFKEEILNLVCPAVAGKFLSHFVNTSIGQLIFSVQSA